MKQKFIMEFLSILLLSFAIGSSLPAAVSEDSNEPNTNQPSTNISSQPKEMQRYMQDLRKQKPFDTVTMKKYIKAHSTHHDDYQQSEETKSENIAKQNNETLRLHPELIPFEISDAKVPDSETLKLIEQNREERKNDSSKDRKVLVKKDMSTAESIMVKITHPGPVPSGNRQRSLQQLPREVQNAINFFVQKENSQKLTSPKYPNTNQYKTPTRLNKNWWTPVHVNTHSVATPLVLHPQILNNFTPTKVTYSKPSPTYQKFETPDRSLHTKLPELQAAKSVKPVDVLYTFKTEYPVYTAPKTILNEQRYASPSLPEKLLTNGDQNLVDLTSLVGLEPDQQLQGLGEILGKQGKYWTNEKPVRPQDSTAPVLFPLGARLPKPRPATEKPLFVVNAVSYSTTSAPEVTSKAFVYNDLKHSYKNTHLLSSPYFNTKDHIPISENTPDILPNKKVVSVVSSRPIFVAPTLEKSKEPKSFQRHYGRAADLFPSEYASGYAFGYRVRDSHTGNDYGHTQNRDTDGITRGEYHIRLPDGRIQNVKYTADEKGFHADVSYQSGN